jgi:hypothetical protein
VSEAYTLVLAVADQRRAGEVVTLDAELGAVKLRHPVLVTVL